MKARKISFLEALTAGGVDPHENFPKRSVLVGYRGFMIELPVNSWLEYFSLSMSAFVKGIGVETGLLEPMFVEKELLGVREDLKQLVVAPDMLLEARAARTAASRLLEASENLNCEEVAKVLTTKRLLLLSMDSSFKLEEGLWTCMRGETGIKLLQGRILDCLPKRDALLSVEESIGRLDVFSKSLVLGFCGRGISGQYDTVQTWLQTMRNGRCPVFGSGTDTGFMQQVSCRRRSQPSRAQLACQMSGVCTFSAGCCRRFSRIRCSGGRTRS